MTTIFIAGSRKFYGEISNLVELLEKKSVSALTPLKPRGESTFAIEKQALLKAFGMIDSSDLVYVFAQDGYVGHTVSMEMAYSFAKGKLILSSEEIVELSARALVNKVLTVSELLETGFDSPF